MRVLLAVDDSACSSAAAEQLRFFFPAADVEVLSVIPTLRPIEALSALATGGSDVVDQEIDRLHAEMAIDAAKAFLGDGNVTYSVATGNPGGTIVDYAADHDVDVIVIGSHGRNVFERLLLGSVATYVSTHAPCPVLVIKAKQAAPIEGPSEGKSTILI